MSFCVWYKKEASRHWQHTTNALVVISIIYVMVITISDLSCELIEKSKLWVKTCFTWKFWLILTLKEPCSTVLSSSVEVKFYGYDGTKPRIQSRRPKLENLKICQFMMNLCNTYTDDVTIE